MEFYCVMDAVLEWDEIIYMKNPYQFGKEIDMEYFTSVLKGTYDLICTFKQKFVSGHCESCDVFDYSRLISVMSKYIPDTCVGDESESHLFTVTCLLTDALVDFAVSSTDISLGDETIKADGQDCPRKICYFTQDEGRLVYDFNTGDYSEFSAYANSEDEIIL